MNAPLALPQVAAPRRVSQATTVEQQRAIAQVLGAIRAAHDEPRDLKDAQAEMQFVCRLPDLANQAFFAVPRGGKTQTGVSVHLARELARCFGNMDYGIAELERDDEDGQSQMRAFATDLQKNVTASTTFVVPHRRGGRNAPQLVDVDDIYLNNANYGARRVREQIIAVLPRWFVAEAEKLCRQTIEAGDGTPLPERIENAVKALASIGVDLVRAEAKVGAVRARWEARDVADLGVLYQSVRQGTVTADEAFPPAAGLSIATLGTVDASPVNDAQAPAPPRDEQPAATEAAPTAQPIDRKRAAALHALLGDAGLGGRDHATRTKKLRVCQIIADRNVLSSTYDLTAEEADVVIDTLRGYGNAAAQRAADLLEEDAQRGAWGDERAKDAAAGES